ncbi:MAG: 2Fe-2S iron-sulfur cluster-binding protein [Myxococcota bacterium]|nr:2Fe-2S iron-sulfur cluster-binding protein [Myxococcota bacterium]
MSVAFTINGVAVEAPAGSNVLDTARSYGFDVPSLCHSEAIIPYGACRLCLVEITKGGRKKTTTSCNYEVLEGIDVVTDSPEIRKHRAMVLELILAEAPDNAHIKKLAAEYGVRKSRFSRQEDAEQHRDDCILCGLCSRVCAEVVEANALAFKGRGDKRSIGPAFLEEPKECIACGACAWACPTNCIGFVEEDGLRKVVRWGRELPLEKDADGRLFAPKFQLFQFSKRAELPPDFYKKAPGAR